MLPKCHWTALRRHCNRDVSLVWRIASGAPMRLSSLSYGRVAPPRTCISATRGSIEWMELAKHIERNLRERGFCVVLEDELERCRPTEKIERGDREKQIQTFAKSRG